MGQTNRPAEIDCDTPVTIIVKRRPKPDHIEDFEKVMSGTTKDAMSFKGHLGANIIRPTKTGGYYRIVFKFDSLAKLPGLGKFRDSRAMVRTLF